MTFDYTIPASAPKTTYVGNAVLWHGKYDDRGVYFDRGFFYVTLY